MPAQNESHSEKCLTNNQFEDRYASYSPDGNWIIFESNRNGKWGIYLMNTDGKDVQRLTIDTYDCRRPIWHPDGKKVLFESDRNGSWKLYTIKIKNKKEKQLTQIAENGKLVFASYSPNGKRIAASLQETEEKSNIVVLSRNGKLKKWLTNNEKRNFYPRWSKDGKEIIYFSRKDTDNQDDEIYRLNIKNGNDVRLTNWHKHNFCPSWSADGKKIVYVTSMEDTRPEIYIMDIDGSNQTRITYNQDGDTLPNWHPKANKILLTAYRNGNYEICELEL